MLLYECPGVDPEWILSTMLIDQHSAAQKSMLSVTRPSVLRSYHLYLSACLRCPDSVFSQWKSKPQELCAESSRSMPKWGFYAGVKDLLFSNQLNTLLGVPDYSVNTPRVGSEWMPLTWFILTIQTLVTDLQVTSKHLWKDKCFEYEDQSY